ncbi:TonB-dependent receptor [Flavobacterium sp. JP2137]|uniref:TonB-dependent receptor n=1 Tax=Flavobacterium sp. JP2137 TaxID=3414510 RepID=UPI003D30078D
MRIYILAFFLMASALGQAQHIVSGRVMNDRGQVLSGSTISVNQNSYQSDAQGRFKTKAMAEGVYPLQVFYMGFQTLDTLVRVRANTDLHLHLQADNTVLDQVVVNASQKKTIYHADKLNQKALSQNFSGSLAKTLAHLPGVNAMEIGAGASKPIIRGLGFNRVAVSENGAKQEGQQWGADHGLEIDALNAEEVEVIKGVGTIEYGSDAMGGVIQINNEKIPQLHSFSGQVTLLGKSVNEALGASVHVQSRGDRFFYKFKATAQEFGDYRVPTDQIVYLNTLMPIYGGRMKNTAGREFNVYGQIGYIGTSFQNILSVSNVYNKSGFFPGSHGLPSIAAVQDDGDSRNIDYPRQNVNHFKVTNSSIWTAANDDKIKLVLAFQNNQRQEWSAFHTHYNNQQPPEVDPALELEFNLNTFDINAKYEHVSDNNHKTTFGFQQNYQNNTIAGYGFLLPKFNRSTVGVFALHEHQLSDVISLQAGTRFDYAQMQVRPFYDELLYDFLVQNGEKPTSAAEYAQRSRQLDKDYSSFNALIGGKWEINRHWNLATTVGTIFRFPTAIELSANGVHHGAFRHELGNPDLKPEKGFAADLRLSAETESFKTEWSPYVYYFNNYIFLKPSGRFSILPDGGQVYQYTESKALLTGFEWKVEKTFWKTLRIEAILEYLYNKQITDNSSTDYPLPFSPPVNVFGLVEYRFKDWKYFKNTTITADVKWTAKQDRIAQNEEITPSSTVFGASIATAVSLGKLPMTMRLTATNLADAKVLNHTSFYRPIQVPEMGRSIQLMLQFPF